jgi:hypothetical protein
VGLLFDVNDVLESLYREGLRWWFDELTWFINLCGLLDFVGLFILRLLFDGLDFWDFEGLESLLKTVESLGAVVCFL